MTEDEKKSKIIELNTKIKIEKENGNDDIAESLSEELEEARQSVKREQKIQHNKTMKGMSVKANNYIKRKTGLQHLDDSVGLFVMLEAIRIMSRHGGELDESLEKYKRSKQEMYSVYRPFDGRGI